MTAQEKLQKKYDNNLHICVGLDTDIAKIPEHLKTLDNPVLEFNKAIIEATKATAAAYKINLAFYEKDGIKGLQNLEETLKLIPEDVCVIGDAKRGDIGNTCKMYAEAMFDHFKFDSTTLNPYMGFDSIEPFVKYEDKVNYILALTSNPSSLDFEKMELKEGRFLFNKVIEKVNEWNPKGNCGIVFGATNTEELKANISTFGDLHILLPGVGAQGGSLEEVVKAFKENGHKKYVINISRGLIYVDRTERFAEKTSEALANYNKIVKEIYSA